MASDPRLRTVALAVKKDVAPGAPPHFALLAQTGGQMVCTLESQVQHLQPLNLSHF